jgi:hypothetical protein
MPSRRDLAASGAQESSLDANLRPEFDTRGEDYGRVLAPLVAAVRGWVAVR